jgi:hypothetical protein
MHEQHHQQWPTAAMTNTAGTELLLSANALIFMQQNNTVCIHAESNHVRLAWTLTFSLSESDRQQMQHHTVTYSTVKLMRMIKCRYHSGNLRQANRIVCVGLITMPATSRHPLTDHQHNPGCRTGRRTKARIMQAPLIYIYIFMRKCAQSLAHITND